MYTEGQTLKITATSTNPYRKIFGDKQIEVVVLDVVGNMIRVQSPEFEQVRGRDVISFPFESQTLLAFYPDWTIEVVEAVLETDQHSEMNERLITVCEKFDIAAPKPSDDLCFYAQQIVSAIYDKMDSRSAIAIATHGGSINRNQGPIAPLLLEFVERKSTFSEIYKLNELGDFFYKHMPRMAEIV